MELTEEQNRFLSECEKDFAERYTDRDEQFVSLRDKPMSSPPIIDPWDNQNFNRHQRGGGDRYRGQQQRGYGGRDRHWGQNRDGRGGSSYNRDRHHPYDNRDRYSNDNRDRHSYDNRDRHQHHENQRGREHQSGGPHRGEGHYQNQPRRYQPY